MVFINEIEPGKLILTAVRVCFYRFLIEHVFLWYINLLLRVHLEFPYSYRDISYLEENIDSGYSDVSGLSSPTSPCQLSPPPSPLRQNQSDAVPFVYYHPIVQYLLIPVPLYPSEPPAVVEQKPFIQEPYLPSPQPDVGQQSHACRLIKWSLPPPTVPFVPLPGWEPMP